MPVGISCGRELVSWSLFHSAVPLRRILGGALLLIIRVVSPRDA